MSTSKKGDRRRLSWNGRWALDVAEACTERGVDRDVQRLGAVIFDVCGDIGLVIKSVTMSLKVDFNACCIDGSKVCYF